MKPTSEKIKPYVKTTRGLFEITNEMLDDEILLRNFDTIDLPDLKVSSGSNSVRDTNSMLQVTNSANSLKNVVYAPYYRYHRDIHNSPRVTECRLYTVNADEFARNKSAKGLNKTLVSVGVSICSLDDAVVKLTGRMGALKKAHTVRQTGLPQKIASLDALIVLKLCGCAKPPEAWYLYVIVDWSRYNDLPY